MLRTIRNGTIHHSAAGGKNFMETADRQIKESLQKLATELTGHDIAYCFIGGVAVKEYGFNRMTVDIDILVEKADEYKLKEVFGGLSDKTKYKIDNIPVDVLFSGERVNRRGINYPHPTNVSEDRPEGRFIKLQNLLILKLDVFKTIRRYKDLGDVQELIRANNLTREYLKGCEPEEYVWQYEKIWDDTYEGTDNG